METPPLFSTEQVLLSLHTLMECSESDATRVTAAKALLKHITSKDDDEAQENETAERNNALAQARGLLAEFAALKHSLFRLERELAQSGTPDTNNAAG